MELLFKIYPADLINKINYDPDVKRHRPLVPGRTLPGKGGLLLLPKV
jgi:hypothetical protein